MQQGNEFAGFDVDGFGTSTGGTHVEWARGAKRGLPDERAQRHTGGAGGPLNCGELVASLRTAAAQQGGTATIRADVPQILVMGGCWTQ